MQLSLTTYAATPSSVTLADGTSTSAFALIAESLDWGNPQHSHSYSGPRGTQGARPGAGVPENRTVTLPIRVYGIASAGVTAKDALASNLKTLNQVADDLRRFGGRVSWQSSNQTYTQYLEVLGTDGTQLSTWTNRAETKSIAAVSLTLVCAPYATADSMDISDTTFASLATDYTADAGSLSNITNSVGKLTASANLTTEQRLIQTSRGYNYGDVEVTVKAAVGSVRVSWKAGAVVWRTGANDYVTAYVRDDGANSQLRIDQSVAGVVTNKASVNLATRVSTGSPGTVLWLRVRTEAGVVYAEHWANAPTPSGTPTTTASWSPAGAWSATTFSAGAVVTYNGYQYIAAAATAATDVPSGSTASTAKWTYLAGKTGITWIPQAVNAEIDSFIVRPFTYSKQTLPKKVSLAGVIPGDAPALANIETTTPQDASWAMFAWQNTPAATTLSSTPTPRAPFQVFNGADDDSTTRSGWSTAVVGALTNNGVYSSSTTYQARYILDPSLLPTDEYSDGDRALEVWALMIVDSSSRLVSPTVVASLQSKDGYGPIRYTDEWGTAGRTIPTLSSTAISAGYRWTRLGTIHLGIAQAREMALTLTGTAANTTSTSATWGITKLVVIPIKQRAALPTAKHAAEFGIDSTYSKWSPAPTATNYTINTAYSAGQVVVFGTSTGYSSAIQAWSATTIYPAASVVSYNGNLYNAALANGVNTSTTTTSAPTASPTFTVTVSASIAAGQLITAPVGTVPAGTTVVSVVGSTVTASANVTLANGATVNFTSSVSTTSTAASSTAVVAVALATGIQVGHVVSGTGIPAGTTVSSIAGLNITLSQTVSVSGSGVALLFAFGPTGTTTSTSYWTFASSLAASNSNTAYRAKNAISTTAQKQTLPANNTTDWEPFEMARLVQNDLGTVSWQPTVATGQLNDRSMGGTLLEVPPGSTDLIAVLAKVVPDDPVASIAVDDLFYPYVASLHVAITPRFSQLRTVS
jgi:hypothetical protein